jgi:hypothetical protein
LDDDRIARKLTREDVEALLEKLRASAKPVPPQELGFIGREFQPDWPGYALKADLITTQGGAQIPYVLEALAFCSRPAEKGQGSALIKLVVNRSMTLVRVYANSGHSGIIVNGFDFHRKVQGPGTGDFRIMLSIIVPHIQLGGDGKEPVLRPFSNAIADVIRKACSAAHRAMARPERRMSVKEAAWSVMSEAYQKASGAGTLPANARQIMYAARGKILVLTGNARLDDAYFTQTLLPDYMEEHPEETAEWDVVFDARGNFSEPHTGREISLGTIEVREYLGDRPRLSPAVALAYSERFSTTGPTNRYSNILFIEKEGFAPLLRAARIAERFDIAIMSTKGMSVTAARMLIDRLSLTH